MAINRKCEDKRHELIQGVIDHVEDLLKKAGFGVELAYQTGVSVADHIVEMWGGHNICFPVEYARKIRERDDLILSMFNGHNWGLLTAETGITERGLRKLLARATARRNAKL